MRTFYIIGPVDDGEGVYSLVTDEGEGLASHFCSSRGYALGDLERNRAERQKEWKEEFGEYKVLYLGEDKTTRVKLLELNKKFYEAHKNTEEKNKGLEDAT